MVTDADRQAAERFRQSTMTLSEAFAAHREAAERAGAQAALEVAAKVAFDTLHPTNPEDDWTEYACHNARNARAVAHVIRAIDPASLCRQTDQESGR